MYNVDAGDGVRVCGKGAHDPCSPDVPYEDSFIIGAADENVALRCECNLVNVIVVTFEGFCVCSTLKRVVSDADSKADEGN